MEEDFFSPSLCRQLNVQSGCGYLSSYFPNGVRFPYEHDVPTVTQQTYGLYAQDTIDMSDRWKAEAGLRLDGYNFQIPQQAGAPPTIGAVAHQRLYEPHLDASYLPDARDTIRIGFGHTLAAPLPSQLGNDVDMGPYAPYSRIPSYDNYDRSSRTVLRTACQPTVRQLRPTTLLADARLSLRKFDVGGAAGGRDVYQR